MAGLRLHAPLARDVTIASYSLVKGLYMPWSTRCSGIQCWFFWDRIGVSVTEITYFHRGGPARHLHHEREEGFYVVGGEYVIEVGDERYELGPGGSVPAPRKAAHV